MADSLKDKVVIITGASSGIGAATLAILEAQGAKIAALDIHPNEKPSDTRLDIKCDVAVEEQCKAAVQQVVDKFGTIDILLNVAGIADKFERVHEMSIALLNKIMAVNFYGPVYLCQAVIPHFLAKAGEIKKEGFSTILPKKGVIVNVCSVASITGGSAGAAYTASKHALLGLNRQTAYNYARDGIRCNAVIPGGVAINIMQNSGIDPTKDFGKSAAVSLERSAVVAPAFCVPQDIADAIIFLATASAVNGAELAVDHGWSAC